MSTRKNLVWFIAGMAAGEFVLRWIIHAVYLATIASLLAVIYLRV